jgi:hypothetical protein
MSERNTMKTFFAAMNEQLDTGGFDSKIRMTNMGPFRWNDLIQLWENVNNGMLMNNISFNDTFTFDYDTIGGGQATSSSSLIPATITGDNGNLTGMGAVVGITRWASTTGPQALLANGSAITITVAAPIQVSITASYDDPGTSFANILYSINGAAGQNYSTPFTISSGQTLKIGAQNANPINFGTTGTLTLKNVNDNNATIETIAFSFG